MLGEGATALAGGKGAGTAAIGQAENAALKNAAKESVNLNTNGATSKFGVYEIEVNGSLYKIGKADCNRITQSSQLPTRLHQQLEKLRRVHGEEKVGGQVVENLGEITTAEAKAAETARIKAYFEQTGTVPPGNQRSFRP